MIAASHIDVDTQRRIVTIGAQQFPCALGRNGTVEQALKQEGDGCTPLGQYPLRYLYWRPDRLSRPDTAIKTIALTPQDGWCDAPNDQAYNQAVTLPYPASAETLWRDDHIYDLIMVIGHNDNPRKPIWVAPYFSIWRATIIRARKVVSPWRRRIWTYSCA